MAVIVAFAVVHASVTHYVRNAQPVIRTVVGNVVESPHGLFAGHVLGGAHAAEEGERFVMVLYVCHFNGPPV